MFNFDFTQLDYLFCFRLWYGLAMLPRLAYGGYLPGSWGLQVHATLPCCVLLPALLFRRRVLINQTIMDMEQILGAFLWFCEVNFVTEESLTQLHWPICSEKFKFRAVLTVDLTILIAIHQLTVLELLLLQHKAGANNQISPGFKAVIFLTLSEFLLFYQFLV